jgi:hypothetical protein
VDRRRRTHDIDRDETRRALLAELRYGDIEIEREYLAI